MSDDPTGLTKHHAASRAAKSRARLTDPTPPAPPTPPAKVGLGDAFGLLDSSARVAAVITILGALFGGIAEVVRIVAG